MSNETKTLRSSSPARWGCYLGLLIALALIGYALHILSGGSTSPMPFKLALLLAGVVQGVTCVYALRGNRPAWSFAVALDGTLFVTFFFGAPKVRDGLDVSLGLGLMPAVVFAVATLLLALGSDDY